MILLPIQLKIGDGLCYDKPSAISNTIDVLTKSRVGHVSMVTGKFQVHEALSKGYTKRGLHESYEDATAIYVKRPVFQFDEKKLVEWCVKHEGVPYDFRGTLWQQLWRSLFGSKIKNNGENKLYCSEADLRAWNAGIGEEYFNPQKSPGDIFYMNKDFETYELKFR